LFRSAQWSKAISENVLGDADGDAFAGPAAVELQVELACESVVDRLDELADPRRLRSNSSSVS
jgi:hypothetical protein